MATDSKEELVDSLLKSVMVSSLPSDATLPAQATKRAVETSPRTADSEEATGAGKRRKHTRWVGWNVLKQGKFKGFSLINTGGHMEWAQVSHGATLWSYWNHQMYYLEVCEGMDPNGWKPYKEDAKDAVKSDEVMVPVCVEEGHYVL